MSSDGKSKKTKRKSFVAPSGSNDASRKKHKHKHGSSNSSSSRRHKHEKTKSSSSKSALAPAAVAPAPTAVAVVAPFVDHVMEPEPAAAPKADVTMKPASSPGAPAPAPAPTPVYAHAPEHVHTPASAPTTATPTFSAPSHAHVHAHVDVPVPVLAPSPASAAPASLLSPVATAARVPLVDPEAVNPLLLGPAFNTRSQTDLLFSPDDMTDDTAEASRLASMREAVQSLTAPEDVPKAIWDTSLVAAPPSAQSSQVLARLSAYVPMGIIPLENETTSTMVLRHVTHAVNAIYMRIRELSRANPNMHFPKVQFLRCQTPQCSTERLCQSCWHFELAKVVDGLQEGLDRAALKRKYVVQLSAQNGTISDLLLVEAHYILKQLSDIEDELIRGNRDANVLQRTLALYHGIMGSHDMLRTLTRACCQNLLEFVATRNEIKLDEKQIQSIRLVQSDNPDSPGEGSKWMAVDADDDDDKRAPIAIADELDLLDAGSVPWPQQQSMEEAL